MMMMHLLSRDMHIRSGKMIVEVVTPVRWHMLRMSDKLMVLMEGCELHLRSTRHSPSERWRVSYGQWGRFFILRTRKSQNLMVDFCFSFVLVKKTFTKGRNKTNKKLLLSFRYSPDDRASLCLSQTSSFPFPLALFPYCSDCVPGCDC